MINQIKIVKIFLEGTFPKSIYVSRGINKIQNKEY